ncbi:MAG: FAD-dependent thymidylate synthase [Oscillospiraceae bacterium]|nr:FAD-dependent thymidylate synthase [Oscillospiraceae bacterium]
MLSVTLLEYTRDSQKLVASAAKLCYSDKKVADLSAGISAESASEFVDMLSEMGHESPMEHASFTFGIDGVSRSLMAQITRHRIASFSVQSQRYVKASEFEFVTPPAIETDEEAKVEFYAAMENARKSYAKLSDILVKIQKERLLRDGVSEEKADSMAQKIAIEDARYVLPNACETKLIVTMNARELKHFFLLRCCNRAQWEIRGLAFQMLKLARRVAPELFKNAGPRCVSGDCKEGKMSCGKAKQMRGIYLNDIDSI